MDNFPKLGMTYKQSVNRGVRFVKEGNKGMAQSVVDQVARCEGQKAANEFAKEILSKGGQQTRRRVY